MTSDINISGISDVSMVLLFVRGFVFECRVALLNVKPSEFHFCLFVLNFLQFHFAYRFLWYSFV